MKKSKYNLIWDLDNGKKIAFNGMTAALAEIEDEFLQMLDKAETLDVSKLNEKEKELLAAMSDGCYINEDDFNELSVLNHTHYKGKYRNDTMNLVVAPTLNCNFSCFYCYESPKNVTMSDETCEAICAVVEKFAAQDKSLYLTWYGGEPLLAKKIIWSLSERILSICREKGCNYRGGMVTNGYLFDEETVNKFVEYEISEVQITLDGPPHVHNARRTLKGEKKESFDKILENIKLLVGYGIKPVIRVNADKTNLEDSYLLLDILKENDLCDLIVYLAQVKSQTDTCKSFMGTCLNSEEFSKISFLFQQKLKEKGFASNGYTQYPGIRANFCSADNINSFVVDPEGYKYKCWNEVGDIANAVGNVRDESLVDEKKQISILAKWMAWTPFDFVECKECKFLPICMGGCPLEGIMQNKPTCEKWKYNIEDAIKFTYASLIEVNAPAIEEGCGVE